jgi:hypothetical protein
MMNGTLETRREEEEIFRELIKPDWMEGAQDEMTEEQRQARASEHGRVRGRAGCMWCVL